MRAFVGVVCLGVALGFLLVAKANPAVQLVDQLNQQRENLFRMISEGLMQRSSLISNFNQTLATIRARYDEAKRSGDLEGLDEGEDSAFYYRIVIDEIRNLKKRFVVEGGEKFTDIAEAQIIANIGVKEAQDAVSKQQAFDSMKAMEEEEELELENELEQMDKLDHQLDHLDKEAEMGWGLDSESKANLTARTKNVLGDLLANELKTLVSIIVTTYLSGTPAGPALGPTVAALNVSLKSKVFEFLMHSIMDILAGLCGRKIETDPKPIHYQLGGAVGPE